MVGFLASSFMCILYKSGDKSFLRRQVGCPPEIPFQKWKERLENSRIWKNAFGQQWTSRCFQTTVPATNCTKRKLSMITNICKKQNKVVKNLSTSFRGTFHQGLVLRESFTCQIGLFQIQTILLQMFDIRMLLRLKYYLDTSGIF